MTQVARKAEIPVPPALSAGVITEEAVSQQAVTLTTDEIRNKFRERFGLRIRGFLLRDKEFHQQIRCLPETIRHAVLDASIFEAAVAVSGRKTDEEGMVTHWYNLFSPQQVDRLQLAEEKMLLSAGVRPQDAPLFIPIIKSAGRMILDRFNPLR